MYHRFTFKRPPQKPFIGAPEVTHVEVMALDHDKQHDGCYWAWWDNTLGAFTVVCATFDELQSCFRYGTEAEAATGSGKVYPVSIIEIA